jgi:multiple sugar transport system permease protein
MNKELKNTVIFIFPLILFVFLFVLFPVLGTFWVSLWRDVSFMDREFLGLTNYLNVLGDWQFYQSVFFTLMFTFISVAIEMIFGVIVALVINEKFPGRFLMRGIALLPWAIPGVIGARIWQLIYRYDYGLANYIIRGISGTSVNWFGTPTGAMCALIFSDVWRTTSFVAIIILAGLQSVPMELYEQGKIDGTGLFQRFIHITVPSIKPVLIVALLFRTIDALRVFDVIYIITGGGPSGSTTSVSLYSYQYFLMGDFGYGATISIVLFIIAFIIALFYLKIGKFREAAL